MAELLNPGGQLRTTRHEDHTGRSVCVEGGRGGGGGGGGGATFADFKQYCHRQRQPRRGERSKGRPSRIWHGDTAKEGTAWNRKAIDRRQWKSLIEGYILQWMDKARVKGER